MKEQKRKNSKSYAQQFAKLYAGFRLFLCIWMDLVSTGIYVSLLIMMYW